MLYLSAQPDQSYFIWQLEILLRNFQSLGVPPEQIHVLVAFQGEKGLSSQFSAFIAQNGHLGTFYTYPDLRDDPKYTSSIRPNILKQHFAAYPHLEQETLFYHDSDILFSRLPNIRHAEKDMTCYVSDTRHYLNVGYIRRSATEQLLDNMLEIVGLSKEKLMQEDAHTGGAQYILKGVNEAFWAKVEKDAEALYVLMKNYNRQVWEEQYPRKKDYKSKRGGIQAWCADMWAVLWNLWLHDKKVEIHAEMDFTWPHSPIEDWAAKAIQHYSGDIKEKNKHFKKTEYINYMPWYDEELLQIPESSCSYKIVQMIRHRKEELDTFRPRFKSCCLVLDGRDVNISTLGNLRLVRNYINKHIDIDVFLLTNMKNIGQPNEWVTETELEMPDSRYDNLLIMPGDLVLDYKCILEILAVPPPKTVSYFHPKALYTVDSLFSEAFSKVLDAELFHINKGKFNEKTVSAVTPLRYCILPRQPKERKEQMAGILESRRAHIPETKAPIEVAYSLI